MIAVNPSPPRKALEEQLRLVRQEISKNQEELESLETKAGFQVKAGVGDPLKQIQPSDELIRNTVRQGLLSHSVLYWTKVFDAFVLFLVMTCYLFILNGDTLSSSIAQHILVVIGYFILTTFIYLLWLRRGSRINHITYESHKRKLRGAMVISLIVALLDIGLGIFAQQLAFLAANPFTEDTPFLSFGFLAICSSVLQVLTGSLGFLTGEYSYGIDETRRIIRANEGINIQSMIRIQLALRDLTREANKLEGR